MENRSKSGPGRRTLRRHACYVVAFAVFCGAATGLLGGSLHDAVQYAAGVLAGGFIALGLVAG